MDAEPVRLPAPVEVSKTAPVHRDLELGEEVRALDAQSLLARPKRRRRHEGAVEAHDAHALVATLTVGTSLFSLVHPSRTQRPLVRGEARGGEGIGGHGRRRGAEAVRRAGFRGVRKESP